MTLAELRVVFGEMRRAGLRREASLVAVSAAWRALTGFSLSQETVLEWLRNVWPSDADAEAAIASGEPGAWRVPFLRALSDGRDTRLAAELAGISRSVAYEARERDLNFRLAWDAALVAGRAARGRQR